MIDSKSYIKPLISVIVPVYNIEKYIQKCVYSLQNQNYRNIEIIIVDDGSQDKSGLLCDEMAIKDNRIQVFHQQNAGVSVARNKGIVHAKGEYIVFVDGDDWCDLEYISSLYESICCVDNCDLVASGFRSLYKEHITNYNEENAIIDLKKRNTPVEILGAPFSKLFKRELIIAEDVKFNATLQNAEDEVFVFQYLTKCKVIRTINKIHYNYVRHSETATFRFNRQYAQCLRQLFNEQILFVRGMTSVDSDVADAYIVTKSYYYFSLAYEYYTSKDRNNLSNFRMIFELFSKEMISHCDEKLLSSKTRSFRQAYIFLIQNHHIFLFWLYYRLRLFTGKIWQRIHFSSVKD